MSLYLKYRPSDFSSLVGQEFTKQTLQKAIDQDKTVGAYLFCGPRGTGKTSSARIFAKAINCLDTQNGNPCGKCKVCTDFKDDRLVDIIEIDAASHTGVDNIRDIIERAQFSPNFCTYKIYIIDEVHMLSKGAFNALLKILEEPPNHVKFILATTETHKVPDTIISRCQRYDFKRISAEDITARLLFIAKSEEVTIDEKSLDYIVKNSGGGLRNAISLFEQLIVDNDINFNVVVEKLGIVDEDVLENFMKKLLQKDTTIIGDFDTLVSDGKNMKVFFKELIFYIKNKAIGELKYNNPIGEYIGVLDILDEVYGKTKNSLDENTTFIIGILKIVSQYTNTQEKTQVSSVQVMDKKKVEIKSTQTSTQEMKQKSTLSTQNSEKQELSHDDVSDVFGDINQPESTPKVENIAKGDIKDFNLKNFILLLKNNGAKGGLTMALRGSGVELIGNSLIIRTKTKIASTQINNVDNIALMSKVLGDMGINNPEIKPN